MNFEQRTSSVFARYKIEDCFFPEPGYYFVELFYDGEFVARSGLVEQKVVSILLGLPNGATRAEREIASRR